MTTLHDDLLILRHAAQALVGGYDVEVVSSDVYINFDYRLAVVLSVEFTESGKTWFGTVTEWDETNGVKGEFDLYAGHDITLLFAAVNDYLEEHEKQCAKFEAIADAYAQASMDEY